MGKDLPRILVVDDERDMCWALKAILASTEYQVVTTTSGTEALQLIMEGGEWPAVFLDAKLPDLDGLELADLIRKNSPGTTVVLVSGFFYREDPVIVQGLAEQRFSAFIGKPFDIVQVQTMAAQSIVKFKEKGQ